MIQVVQNWTGTDAELLTELNRKQFKKVIGNGLVTLPMVASVDMTLAATLNYTLQQVIASKKVSDPPLGSFLDTFYQRLTTSSFGIDLSNDALRAQMTQLLSGAGWEQAQIDAVLSIGAVYESIADRTLGRVAIQSDIDAARAVIARAELQQDYNDLYHANIQPVLETGTREQVANALEAVAELLRN